MAEDSQNAAKSGGRIQIGPRLTPATKERLDQVCRDHLVSVSDVVERALVAYLTTDAEPGAPQGMAQTLATLQARVEDMYKALGILITLLTPKAPEKEPERPKIATYAEMYGPITAVEELEGSAIDATLLASLEHASPPEPQPSGWRGWFQRKEER